MILFGNLASSLPKYLERSVRQRLEPDVEWEVIGRRVRLSANSNEALGRALAVVLSAGVAMDSFRSPTGGIESLMRYRIAA
jgi:ABC-2 type transport system ATP-binding protein